MTNYVADVGCDARSHRRDMAAYDRLHSELRDRLRRSRDNLCSHCVRQMLRRQGLEQTLKWLDFERTHRAAFVRHRGRVLQIQVREPELKP